MAGIAALTGLGPSGLSAAARSATSRSQRSPNDKTRKRGESATSGKSLVSVVRDVPAATPAVLTGQQATERANTQAARVTRASVRRRAGALRSSTVLASGLGGAATTKTLLGS